jgi:cytoskeletal protein CcmA (bactofilin family)
MKGLFRSQEAGELRKELDKRGIIAVDDKPKKKERLPAGGDNLNAFIGEGTAFKGTLSFQGPVRIDGNLEGEIFTKDTLVVGKSAVIRADIHAGALVIGGTIHGNITAENKVELHSGARLYGNIGTPSLVIAEGVVFEGSCTMGQRQGSPGVTKSEETPASRPAKVLSA